MCRFVANVAHPRRATLLGYAVSALGSRPSISVIRNASQRDGSKISDTGTAVTTMKLCNLPIPPDPVEIRIKAITPIAKPQNARMADEGSPEVMVLEIT